MITRALSFGGSLSKRPVLRFAAVGGLSTAIDIAILKLLLVVGVDLYVSTAAGFLTGTFNGYVLNSRLVFRLEHDHRRFLKYLAVSTVGFFLTEGLVYLFHERADWTPLEAKLGAVAIVFAWNYTASRLWAFR